MMNIFDKYNIRIFPISIWYIIFSIIPLLIVVVYSFSVKSSTGFVGDGFSIENYLNSFTKYNFSALKRSFINSFLTAFVLIFLAIPFSYQLAKFKSSKKLLLLIVVPFLSSTLLRLYSVTFLFRDTGLVNSFLDEMQINTFQFLYSQIAVFIVFLFFYFPFMCLPIYLGFNSLDNNLNKVAIDLGMKPEHIFMKLKLPVIRKSIYNGFSLVFLLSLGDFLIPQIIGGDKKLYLANVIFNGFTQTRNWVQSCAISIELIVLGILFVIIFQAFVEKLIFKRFNV